MRIDHSADDIADGHVHKCSDRVPSLETSSAEFPSTQVSVVDWGIGVEASGWIHAYILGSSVSRHLIPILRVSVAGLEVILSLTNDFLTALRITRPLVSAVESHPESLAHVYFEWL